jgi:hypothetical protein
MDDTYDISIVDKALNLGKKSTAKPSSQPNLEGLNPDFASRLQEAQSAYRERFKKELPITSAVRTSEQQAKLAANPNKKYPAAPAGTSQHEYGNAIDINPNVPDEFLNEFGLHRPHGKKDLVHVEAMPNFEKSMPGDYDISVVDTALKPAPQSQKTSTAPSEPTAPKARNPIAAGARTVAGVLDTAIGGIQSLPGAFAAEVGYAGAKGLEGLGFVKPGVAERGREAMYKQFVEPYSKPVGQTFGVTQTPEYQGEASQQAMQFVGQNMDKGADWISAQTGIPKPMVENMMFTLSAAAGPAGGKIVKPVAGKVLGAVDTGVDTAINAAKAAKEKFAPNAALEEQFKRKKLGYTEGEPAQLAGVGAARAEFNPYGGLISGEEGARGAYPTVKLSKIRQDAPPKEQAVRQEILQDVLGNQTNGIRQGVLTGNEDMLRNEYTLAKKGDTPASQIMKDQLAKEQTAISNYAQDRVNRTGANQNFANDYERGQAINNAFAGDEGVTGWFKQQKNDLYQTAKDTVGDNPITTNNVDSLLSNKQFRASLGLKGNENVAKSAENLINLAKTVGFEDEFGTFHPANSISSWDAVRKSLNQNWTKDNASVIRKINQAIDKDVATAGGGDLYKAADRMHQAEKTLFGSKGIKTLFGDVDPNGVQAGTAFDVIPQKLNSMPFDQWRHIYDTADQLSRGTFKVNGELVPIPEDIRIAAQAAKNEMKGSIARDIYSSGGNKVGEWNSNAANKRMNFLDQKIKHAFDPEEIQSFHKLNYAGQLMPTHGYEGAALQTSRLERVSEKFPAAGGVVGGAVAGPKGAIAGQYLGEKSKGLFKNRSQRQAAERLQQQLEENFRKGRE